METKAIKKPVCRGCGGDNITCDATAAWDVDAGAWSLAGTQDMATCQDCDYVDRAPPFVVWTGNDRGAWVPQPEDADKFTDKTLARLNDSDATNPEFADLSAVTDDTQIALYPVGEAGATWRGPLGDFIRQNSIGAMEGATMRANLQAEGEFNGGGGAFIEYTVRLATYATQQQEA